MAEQACLSKVKGLILQLISNLKMSIARLIRGFLRNQESRKCLLVEDGHVSHP